MRPNETIVIRHREDEKESDANAAAVERIELTRSEMSGTIEAIQDKLDPEVLSEHAKETARDVTDYAVREAKEAAKEITEQALVQARAAVQDMTGQAKLALHDATIGRVENMTRMATDGAGELRQAVVETIKANPLPAAIVGLGLGWMFLNRSTSSSSRPSSAGYTSVGYDSPGRLDSRQPGGLRSSVSSTMSDATHTVGKVADRAQDTASQMLEGAQDTAGSVAERVQGTAGQVVDQVQDTGGAVADQVQMQASRAQNFLQTQLEENPLLVGAVAIAIGGVLAGTVRSTPREDQLLGTTRDRVVGTAKEMTQEAVEKVSHVVDEAQTAARQAAQQEAQEQSLIPPSTGSGSAA